MQWLSCADREAQVCSDLNEGAKKKKSFLVRSILIGSRYALNFFIDIFPVTRFLIVLLSKSRLLLLMNTEYLLFQHSVFFCNCFSSTYASSYCMISCKCRIQHVLKQFPCVAVSHQHSIHTAHKHD